MRRHVHSLLGRASQCTLALGMWAWWGVRGVKGCSYLAGCGLQAGFLSAVPAPYVPVHCMWSACACLPAEIQSGCLHMNVSLVRSSIHRMIARVHSSASPLLPPTYHSQKHQLSFDHSSHVLCRSRLIRLVFPTAYAWRASFCISCCSLPGMRSYTLRRGGWCTIGSRKRVRAP